MVKVPQDESTKGRSARPDALAPALGGLRLRHLLGVAVFLGAVAWVWPRGQAAWRLHNQAVALADYGLCMVGPTGVDVLRDDPSDFLRLVRRRIVQSMPGEQPLVDCAALAEKLGLPHKSYRLHAMRAEDFVEYYNRPAPSGSVSLRDLVVNAQPLERLAERAWPFVRRGYADLMQPSSHAAQAMHPTKSPEAGWGSGLPGRRTLYRSSAAFGDTFVVAMGSGANAQVLLSKDGGRHFESGGRRLASDLMDRCVADEEGRGFTLSRMGSGERIVVSQGPGAAPQIAILAKSGEKLAGIACDAAALVAALALEPDATGYRPIILKECPFRRPCRTLHPPSAGSSRLYYPLDVARMSGDTIVARASGGITRVSSSRDGGRSWTPWTVAYDAKDGAEAATAPFRLLAVGDTLLLYTGGEGKYPLLVSEDHGASFLPTTAHSSAPEAPAVTAQLLD